jgi:hypothetical protein
METPKAFHGSLQESNREIFMKKYTNQNFLTIQVILTNNIPINSVQQAQGIGNIISAQNSILREHSGIFIKTTPQ